MDDEELGEILINIFLLHHFFKNHDFQYRNFDGRRKITFNHYLTLMILKKRKKLPISEIGRLTSVKKQNMTYIIDRLVEIGLVKRVPDMSDRRVVNITITDGGIKYLDKWQKLKLKICVALMMEI